MVDDAPDPVPTEPGPEPAEDQPQPSERGLGTRDASFDREVVFLEGDPSRPRLGEQLRAAVTAALGGPRGFAFAIRPVPVGVRGPAREEAGPAPIGPASLELGDEELQLLGERAQSHALLGGGELQVWLIQLEGLAADAAVALVALGPDGEPLVARGRVPADPSVPLKLSLPWPEDGLELALAVEAGGESGEPPR
ncbi:MAG TPA: hypothetical protein VMS60_16055 [Solirubrobacterales bacterium]|nr:hypothetical protein [Solirubrobacterales bacterium]